MRSHAWVTLVVVASIAVGGCTFSVNVGGNTQAPGPDVVLNGEAVSVEDAACVTWLADDGRDYTLYQDVDVPNADFDAVVTPGTRSRLLIRTDKSLGPSCRAGATPALVQQVLQIGGVDMESPAESSLSALVTQFEISLEEMSTAIQSQVQAASDELRANADAFRDQASQAIEEKKAAIVDGLPEGDHELAGAVEAAIEGIRNHVRTRVEEALGNLDLAGDGFLADLRQAAADLREQLRAGVDDLEQKLTDRENDTFEESAALRAQIATRLEAASDELRSRLAARAEELRARLEDRVSGRLNDWEDRILAIVDRLPERIRPDLPDLGDQLPEITEGITVEVDEELGELARQRDEALSDVESELTATTSDLQATMADDLTAIEADLPTE